MPFGLAAVEEETRLPWGLLGLTVGEVVELEIVSPANGAALSAETIVSSIGKEG